MNAANWEETLALLNDQYGLRVRISHLRQFKLREQYRPSDLMSVGAFNGLPEQMFRPSEIYEVAPRGGMTLCQLIRIEEPQTIVVELSVECRKSDHYSKRIGRTKALGRALHELKTLNMIADAEAVTEATREHFDVVYPTD